MDGIRRETVSAFNDQIKAIRATARGSDTRVSLITFSTRVDEPMIWNKPVRSLRPIECKDYVPTGFTAMYDAVGSTIARLSDLEEAKDPSVGFLVVVISDGEENHSKEWTSEALARKITVLQKTGRWTFTYLGANQDLSKISKKIGIPIGNTMAFTATPQGVLHAQSINSAATARYIRARVDGGTPVDQDFYTAKSVSTVSDRNLAKLAAATQKDQAKAKSVIKTADVPPADPVVSDATVPLITPPQENTK
jgi:hypothetical protein